MRSIEVNDEVLVFGKYEGTVLEIKAENVMVFCPDFDAEAPYLVTAISNVTLLLGQSYKGLIN